MSAVRNNWLARRVVRLPQLYPTIVYICGPQGDARRVREAYREAEARETLEAGHVVLTCESCTEVHFGMHKFKIDLADEVLVLNVGGRVDETMTREMEYARSQGKVVRYLEEVL